MNFRYLFIIIILSSCTLPDYNYNDGKEVDYDGTVIINNSISEINIDYSDEHNIIKIWLENNSDIFIHEIQYRLNEKDIFVYKMIVPNQIVYLYYYKYTENINITCEIVGIKYNEF